MGGLLHHFSRIIYTIPNPCIWRVSLESNWDLLLLTTWGSPEMSVPKNGWFKLEIPSKWMILGYHQFKKTSTCNEQYDDPKLISTLIATWCCSFFSAILKLANNGINQHLPSKRTDVLGKHTTNGKRPDLAGKSPQTPGLQLNDVLLQPAPAMATMATMADCHQWWIRGYIAGKSRTNS